MANIDPSLHQTEIECLFNEFYSKKAGVIQIDELY
jgi:hypothetical protein